MSDGVSDGGGGRLIKVGVDIIAQAFKYGGLVEMTYLTFCRPLKRSEAVLDMNDEARLCVNSIS